MLCLVTGLVKSVMFQNGERPRSHDIYCRHDIFEEEENSLNVYNNDKNKCYKIEKNQYA